MQVNLKTTLSKEDTKDKYIFGNIDGTLATIYIIQVLLKKYFQFMKKNQKQIQCL